MRKLLGAVTMVVLVAGLSACAEAGDAGGHGPQRADRSDAVFDALRAGASLGSQAGGSVVTLRDVLPNTLIEVDGNTPVAMGGGVYVGTIASVQGVTGWRFAPRQPDGEQQTSFDDPDADWRTASVTVSVERSWSPADPVADPLVVSVTSAPPLTAAEFVDGLDAMGRVIIALDRLPTPAGTRSIALGGAALGQVGDGDRISFPVLQTDDPSDGDPAEAEFLDGVQDLGDLATTARLPERTVIVRHGGVAGIRG